MMGSTETTFYVIAVYFGSVGSEEHDMQFLRGCWQIWQGLLPQSLFVVILLVGQIELNLIIMHCNYF